MNYIYIYFITKTKLMESIELYKKHKEERKQEKELLKKEKAIQKNKEKRKVVSLSKWKSKPKKVSSGKSTKRKLLSRKWAINKLDKLTSQIVRYKNADINWNIKCISCGCQLHWKEAQCCHWIERWRQRYRFDYENLAPWCRSCNYYRKEYHLRIYTMKQVNKLWKKKVREMLRQSDDDKNTTYKLPTPYIRELLEERIQEHKDLFNEKIEW